MRTWRPDQGAQRLTSFVALCALSFGVAAYALAVYGFLPLGSVVHPDMRASFVAHRLGIHTHIFASVVALALGPLQLSSRLRSRHLAMHRWLGRLYLGVGVLLGSLSGLYMALHAFGGIPARTGFALLAIAWLYTGVRAYLAIRAGSVTAHRRWIIRNFALTFAAVTLRIYLPASVVASIPFETAYPAIAWLCWVPNLVAAELWLSQRFRPSTGGTAAK